MQIPNQGSVSPNGDRAMENFLIFLVKDANFKYLGYTFAKTAQKVGECGIPHSATPAIGIRFIFRIRN